MNGEWKKPFSRLDEPWIMVAQWTRIEDLLLLLESDAKNNNRLKFSVFSPISLIFREIDFTKKCYNIVG